jgi:hypothetical protein
MTISRTPATLAGGFAARDVDADPIERSDALSQFVA